MSLYRKFLIFIECAKIFIRDEFVSISLIVFLIYKFTFIDNFLIFILMFLMFPTFDGLLNELSLIKDKDFQSKINHLRTLQK